MNIFSKKNLSIKVYRLLRRFYRLTPIDPRFKSRLTYFLFSSVPFLKQLRDNVLLEKADLYLPKAGIPIEPGVVHDYLQSDQYEGFIVDGVAEWADYEPTRAQIEQVRSLKRIQQHPKPIPIFSVGTRVLSEFAKDIKLPALTEAPEVSIIVPVFNHIALTLECLYSISLHTEPGISYEVLVADDASSDETMEVLKNVPNIVYLRNAANLGFLRNCNNALKSVSGNYVVFLNNDTQVTSGWLNYLHQTFFEKQNVGAVGPKFVYPNGLLQEAGGAFRHDAFSDMVGLNENASRARYNYTRRVDYVSGACLMAPKELIQELGGFSEDFLPCYCEDSDLCLRIREAGFEVYYNSKAVIIHHLSKTTANIDSDFKLRSISKNTVKLKQKWIDKLSELSTVKTIAFYMSNYYPSIINENFGGKGHSGWNYLVETSLNSTTDKKLIRLPSDLGFYDQRKLETLHEQASLAKRYGIEGFCFYTYVMNGEIVDNEPLSQMLLPGAPEISYCICLSDFSIDFYKKNLVGKFDESNCRENFSLINTHFNNVGYMKIADSPILLIKIDLYGDDTKKFIHFLKEYLRSDGTGDVFIIIVHSVPMGNTATILLDCDFDATLEFPEIPVKGSNYTNFVVKSATSELPAYPQFRCAYPGWGYTDADSCDSRSLWNPTPGAFQAWMESLIEDTRIQHFGEERLVFIHAWNDWVQGACLEPERNYGHSYLEALQNANDAPSTLENYKRYLIKSDRSE
jgi:GT2 family glycosyltransferase